jgi:formamidopyrimidine-DNA glycosylase
LPELPEVETVRRGLNRVTLHSPIRGGAALLERAVAHPISIAQFWQGIVGAQIVQWHRRGKYLLAELQSDGQAAGWLGVHLRMTGQLLWVKPTEAIQPHCRIRFFLGSDDQELRFVDQRTFGRVWWVPPEVEPQTIMTGLSTLGPEPFDPNFNANYLYQACQGRKRSLKAALLDQALVAGIGNIYADEALYLSGIRPQTLCLQLTRKQAQRLHQAIVQVLSTSIEAGGTTFSDYRDIHGINGNYGGVAWVYDRDGQPCRTCGTTIERLKLVGRSAHFCPKCQR